MIDAIFSSSLSIFRHSPCGMAAREEWEDDEEEYEDDGDVSPVGYPRI